MVGGRGPIPKTQKPGPEGKLVKKIAAQGPEGSGPATSRGRKEKTGNAKQKGPYRPAQEGYQTKKKEREAAGVWGQNGHVERGR